ncbi:hypothetical protein FHG87_015060 [Trinorchestia longiramus]|nr:hypothetical protein FHG87_015060 [Trinorchestia longiramus]
MSPKKALQYAKSQSSLFTIDTHQSRTNPHVTWDETDLTHCRICSEPQQGLPIIPYSFLDKNDLFPDSPAPSSSNYDRPTIEPGIISGPNRSSAADHTTSNLFSFPNTPIYLTSLDLWLDLVSMATFLSSVPSLYSQPIILFLSPLFYTPRFSSGSPAGQRTRGLRRNFKFFKAAASSSRQSALPMKQFVSWTDQQYKVATHSPNSFCGNALFHLCLPKVKLTQLRVFSSPAPNIQHMNEVLKKKVRSLLDEGQPTGHAKFWSGDLSHTERNKASSLVPQYLVSIATDPNNQHESILEIFHLYALTMRPLAQDKIDFPEEFECLLTTTGNALQQMSITELQVMSQYLGALQSQQLALIRKLIRELCQECSARLYHKPTFIEAMNLYDLTLTMYSKALPQKYHEIFNEYFLNNLESASLREKVKLMYFYSLNPRPLFTSLVEELLKSTTPHISSMPLKMQGIVSFSVFKSGVKVHQDLPLLPELVPNLVSCLLSNHELDELEAFSVQSELDLMRLSRYHNVDVTSALEAFLVSCNEENYFTMQNMQCVLAFLATRSYNQMVFEKIEAGLMKILCDENRESLQLPELARILWAMSATSHNCSSSFIEEIKKELHSQLAVNLVNNNLFKFVDSLLSLAMMGHIDLKLCRHAFLPPKGRAVSYGGHLEVKLLSRISALRECLSVERPDVVIPTPTTRSVSSVPPEPAAVLQARPVLSKLYSALSAAFASSSPDVALSFGCPLKTVKLAGICLQLNHQDNTAQIEDEAMSTSGEAQVTFANGGGGNSSEPCDQRFSFSHCSKTKDAIGRLTNCLTQLQRPVSLEVLDHTNTIAEGSDNRRHNGMLNYKLRLMGKMGWKCVLISKEDVENADDVISLVHNKLLHSCQGL